MEEKDGKTIEFDDPTTHRSGVAMIEAGRYRSPVGASGWGNGPAIVTYSFSDLVAIKKADEIEQNFLEGEVRFPFHLHPVYEGVKLVLENSREGWPILLADVRNESSAGSTSDTTGLPLNALVEHRVRNCAMADLYDVYAVEESHQAGIGSEFSCELSGKFGGFDIPAFRGTFKVAALSDG